MGVALTLQLHQLREQPQWGVRSVRIRRSASQYCNPSSQRADVDRLGSC